MNSGLISSQLLVSVSAEMQILICISAVLSNTHTLLVQYHYWCILSLHQRLESLWYSHRTVWNIPTENVLHFSAADLQSCGCLVFNWKEKKTTPPLAASHHRQPFRLCFWEAEPRGQKCKPFHHVLFSLHNIDSETPSAMLLDLRVTVKTACYNPLIPLHLFTCCCDGRQGGFSAVLFL